MNAPSFADVLRARRVIEPHLPRTPLIEYPSLSRLVGTRLLVKHENHQPVGAFKVRGGINLVSQLSPGERSRGIIGASTGNHGQSIAYAGELFGVPATIVVPEKANPVKVAAMQNLGARVLHHGADFDAAREHCERLAKDQGLRYVHSGNEPHLIAGVATIALEIFEDAPDVDVIITPIGGGSGAAGACLVADRVKPDVQLIGVQAEKAPAAYKSWKEKKLLADKMETAAEGLATRTAFQLPQEILWRHLRRFELVSEAQIETAILDYLREAHSLAEGAGAASLAAAKKIRSELKGKTVAVVLSGGNISPQQLRRLLASAPA